MPGVKGQKWSVNRPEPKIKINTAVDKDIADKVQKIAVEKRWSISSTVAFILEEYFRKIKK